MSQLDEMKTLVAIADAESLTGASQAMGIALSAVSRRLKDLEHRLGTTLILRSTRSISFTTAGADYLLRSRQILDDIKEAEFSASEGAAVLSGRIRLAAPLTFSTQHLGRLLFDFMTDHPEVDVELDLSDRQVDLIGEGFDLAVRIGQLTDSSLIARRLTSIRHIPCAAPELLDKFGKPERPEDLAKFPILTYRSARNKTVWPFVRPDGTNGHVKANRRMTANNGEIVRMAAERGLGVILEPTFITHEAIASGALVPMFCDHNWSDNAAYAVYAPNRSLPKRVRALIDYLAEAMASDPEWDKVLKVAP